MIAFARTSDLSLVRSLISGDARVWDAATDDGSPSREDFTPNDHPAIWYVVGRDGAEIISLYTLIPVNAVCWELHVTRFFPRAGAEALLALQAWAFRNVPGCRRILATVTAANRLGLRALRCAGFIEYGRNPGAFLKHGQLHDLILLGVSAGLQDTTSWQAS